MIPFRGLSAFGIDASRIDTPRIVDRIIGMTDVKKIFDLEVLKTLSRKHKIKTLSLFGSVLRHDFNENSDIDILVEFLPETDYSLFELYDIQEDFSSTLGRKVDLVEKQSLRNPYRKKRILETARKIYESE